MKIRTDVQAHHPTTLTMAIGLAKLYEARELAQRKMTTIQQRTFNQQPKVGIQNNNPPSAPTVRKMTPAELSERRKRGLCFHCNNKYNPGHKCAKLFHIKACWEDYDEDGDIQMEIEDVCENATPKISLHAMARDQAPETMRVWGSIKGKSVVILIDSGSTHNFINAKTAQRVNLNPIANSTLKVIVASGEQLVSSGKCTQINFKLQRIPFTIDFFILPMEGYDMVLGTQWLRTLGLI